MTTDVRQIRRLTTNQQNAKAIPKPNHNATGKQHATASVHLLVVLIQLCSYTYFCTGILYISVVIVLLPVV